MANLLDVIVGGALALSEGRPKWCGDLSAHMPSGASLSKNWKQVPKDWRTLETRRLASSSLRLFPACDGGQVE